MACELDELALILQSNCESSTQLLYAGLLLRLRQACRLSLLRALLLTVATGNASIWNLPRASLMLSRLQEDNKYLHCL
jgi:hypothetical protein